MKNLFCAVVMALVAFGANASGMHYLKFDNMVIIHDGGFRGLYLENECRKVNVSYFCSNKRFNETIGQFIGFSGGAERKNRQAYIKVNDVENKPVVCSLHGCFIKLSELSGFKKNELNTVVVSTDRN